MNNKSKIFFIKLDIYKQFVDLPKKDALVLLEVPQRLKPGNYKFWFPVARTKQYISSYNFFRYVILTINVNTQIEIFNKSSREILEYDKIKELFKPLIIK